LLTADTAISHHDPAVQDDSNRNLFNRQKQLLTGPVDRTLPDQATVDDLTAIHRLPESIADLFDGLTLPEFVATALVRLFLDIYNSQDGIGLFEGMERYPRLEARLRQAAVCSHTLTALWDRLVAAMQVPVHGGEFDLILLRLLRLPAGLQALVLQRLVEDYRSVVALARLWHAEAKLSSGEYAAALGKAPVELVYWDCEVETAEPGADRARVVEVPAVSGNSLRHEVVREPAWLHLCQHLVLAPATPGQGPVPAGVEAVFYNGGNIAAGAKQPTDVYGLSWRIRTRYPSLDLLGGVCDSFDLGESRLAVAGWLICRENREALRGSPAYDLPAASVSVFDLLDDVTLTRQAGPTGLGQLISACAPRAAAAQVLCRLNLRPYTTPLTRGALVAAVETYLTEDATIGGQAARGFGRVRGEWLVRPEGDADYRADYEEYLAEHRDELRQGLVDGTLGTGKMILS
jgi:hypothetical protein